MLLGRGDRNRREPSSAAWAIGLVQGLRGHWRRAYFLSNVASGLIELLKELNGGGAVDTNETGMAAAGDLHEYIDDIFRRIFG